MAMKKRSNVILTFEQLDPIIQLLKLFSSNKVIKLNYLRYSMENMELLLL